MTKFYSRRCPRRFRNSIPGSEKPSAPKRFRGFFVSHLSAGSKTARPCFSHRKKGFCRRQDPVFLPCVAGKKICFPSLLFLGSFGILLSISFVSLADAAHQFLLLLRPGAFLRNQVPGWDLSHRRFSHKPKKQGKPFRFPCFSHITRHIFTQQVRWPLYSVSAQQPPDLRDFFPGLALSPAIGSFQLTHILFKPAHL